MKAVIYGLIFLLPVLGHAGVQQILDITSESDPSSISIMSIDLGAQNDVKSLLYRPDSNLPEIRTYAIEKLLKDTVTMKSEKSVEIVGVNAKKINATSYIVTLHYLYEFKLFKKTYKDKQLNVAFSTPDNRYLVQDPTTKKIINRLHFVSHYNDKGKEVGIERIETL